MFSLFLTFTHHDPAARLGEAEYSCVTEIVRTVTAVQRAHVFTPEIARDRYFDDGPSPLLTLQLYFDRLEALEAAVAADGPLHTLFDPATLPTIAASRGEQQAMWTRAFTTPAQAGYGEGPACSYLVHYPGRPEDLNAWLRYYFANHARIMGTFPGVREVEVFTHVDWVGTLPLERVAYFQRNKIVFDSAAALEAALNSDVREEMKADRARFPPFSGTNIHFPMATDTVVGPRFVPCFAPVRA